MSGPLAGIRVLDLTSVVFGPLATQMLGDMGADVIKIEAPEGDTTRHTGPARSKDMAALFMGVNRSKRSLVLDLKQQGARDALWRLIDGADVFAHSMRPQKIESLGFGDKAVRARNPRIVYAGLHGYLEGGPYSGQPAYDDVIQGQSGVAALMAEIAGEPRYAPMILADKTCGLVAANAISAALYARERTGRGQFVEVPMFETMAAFVLTEHLFGHTFVPPEAPLGYPRVLAPWRRPYKTSGRPYLHARLYRSAVAEILDAWSASRSWRTIRASTRWQAAAATSRKSTGSPASASADRTTDEWLPIFQELEIPAARVASLDDLMHDPQLEAVGLLKQATHPTEGEIMMTDPSVRFSDTRAAIERLQPKLGEHSVEILGEAGLSNDEIAKLVASGATLDGRRPPP